MAGLSLLNSLANLLSQQQGASHAPSLRHKVQYSSATCLDPECRTTLFFPSHEASVECPSCGQRHTVGDLPDRHEVSDKDNKFRVELAQLRQSYKTGKKTPELVKVKGISNYQCKLLSPLLTEYGMDKSDNPKLLKELGMRETFDCAKLASRAFAIDESHFKVTGYGRDRSGSEKYLHDTLKEVQAANSNVECLVPVHADGDGHCLVHAISRCLVGRELFWHALRTNLHSHLTTQQEEYKKMFKDFISDEEWDDIIAESAPDFHPPDGQSLGLRNIHVFGLANVLRRPIILLDSLSGMRSKGDYSGIFLPSLHTPEECSSKDASGVLTLNSPIVIAWSSMGRNHFIPLVPVRGRPLPKLPPKLQPKVWGVEEDTLKKYVSLDANGCIEVCRGKELADRYLHKLVACMERLFFEKHEVVPSLVAEVDQYVYRSAGCVGLSTDVLIDSTRSALRGNRLFRCLICSALSCVPQEWLCEGGNLYDKATEQFDLEDKLLYNFPFDGITAVYDKETDLLVPAEVNCFWCMQMTRQVQGSGKVIYQNGDRTDTVSQGSRCGCGYMHYWDGKEYDNLPEKVPLKLMWAGRSKEIFIHWFQYESDPSRNSNVYEVAQKAVNDNFPGEFGSERLVQEIVDRLLAVTETRENMEQVTGHHPTSAVVKSPKSPTTPTSKEPETTSTLPSSKIILTGQKSKTLHKEELTVSETERRVKRKIEENARQQQQGRRKGGQGVDKKTATPVKTRTSLTPPPPTKATPPSPTGGSPSPTSQPAKKKIKVTSSDGKTANLTLDPSVTFTELQAAIERELSIPPERQRLRCGFPPKELKPGSDPTHPLELTNGERVSVDIIESKQDTPIPKATPINTRSRGVAKDSTMEAGNTLNTLMQLLTGENVDFWVVGQSQPQMFQKGGEYYQQVVGQYGTQLKTGTHLQFREFPNKVFAFNAEKERLELCLGLQHIPVAPLTPEQEKLASAAALVSATPSTAGDHQDTPPHTEEEGISTFSGAYKVGGAKIKAFSGKGHTLSSGTSNVGGALEDRGDRRSKRQVEESSKVNWDEDQDGRLLETAQMVVQKRLTALQSREKDLQQKVRAINRQLVSAEHKQDGASVRDDLVSSLETELLDSSSELKQVREQIRELTTIDIQ